MIAANGATARFLVDKGFPSLRRFLQAPRGWAAWLNLRSLKNIWMHFPVSA
jgi:hypothetical protein